MSQFFYTIASYRSVDELSGREAAQIADENCTDCHGEGRYYQDGDWVPWGNGWDKTPDGYCICGCVAEAWETMAAELSEFEDTCDDDGPWSPRMLYLMERYGDEEQQAAARALLTA
jgi:hypothetical protein